MTATVTAIDNFAKTVKQHTGRVGDSKKILAQIEKVKTASPQVYEKSQLKTFFIQRAKAMTTLIDSLLVAKLSEVYPLLDNSIFNLKRYIYVRDGQVVDDQTVKNSKYGRSSVSIFPSLLFCRVPVGTPKFHVGSYSKTKNYRKTTISLSVNTPQVPQDIQVLGNKAMALYYNTIAGLYDNPVTSDVVQGEMAPTLEILWIPTTTSLNVKIDVKRIPQPKVNVDPALLLKHRDRYYLVGLWDIKEELPFENILREFTVGDVKFPKKEKSI